MKFSDIKSRLTGISCPIFGISWKPSESEVDAGRRIVTYLEDRRVLFAPHELEVPRHCAQSVLEMRRYLTGELARMANADDLADHVRAMRTACRKFLDVLQEHGDELLDYGASHGHWASWVFNSALGELRGVVGIHVLQIATKYGLDVEDELATILPNAVENDALADDRDVHLLPPRRRP